MAGMLDYSALKVPGAYNPNSGSMYPTAAAPPVAATPSGGGILDALFAPKTAAPMSNGDRWQILGATLKDMGAGLRGDRADALAATRQALGETAGAPAAVKGAKKAPGQPTDTALLYQTAQNLFPGDPKAQFLFATGNGDFLKSIGEGYGFHTATGGDTVYGAPGQSGPYVAPKLVDHDGVYGTQTAGGYQGSGQAAPSYNDTTGAQNALTAAKKAVDDAAHYQRADSTDAFNARTNQGRLGVEQGQLGLGRDRLGFDVRNASAGRTPGVAYVQSQTDIDALPPGAPFIAVHDPFGVVRHK